MHQARFKISGRVQEVSYRFYAKEKATELGLKGFIRNIEDGTVEAVLQSSNAESLTKFRIWAFEGSPSSRVDNVEMKIEEPEKPYYSELKIH